MEVTDVVAILIALFALGLAVWEGIENRRHNRLSTRPLLVFITQLYADKKVGLFLNNLGPGPAIVSDIRAKVDGKEFGFHNPDDVVQVAKELSLYVDWAAGHYVGKGSTISSGEKQELLSIQSEATTERIALFRQALSRLELTVKYDSLYRVPDQSTYKWREAANQKVEATGNNAVGSLRSTTS